METVWIVEEERQSLLRIMVSLVAMAGAASLPKSLPRLFYRAILRILRPAEFAARRIVIAFAREIKLPPPKPLKPDTLAILHTQYRALGLAIPWDPNVRTPIRTRHPDAAKTIRTPMLPLFDPLPTVGRTFLMRTSVPRISFGGDYEREPVPPRPSPDDLIDTTRIGQRIAAVIAALEDMPRHALRYARWRERMRVERQKPGAKRRRTMPIRNGYVPGGRSSATREVREVLKRVQPFAHYAINYPDDS